MDVIRNEFEEGKRIDLNFWTKVFNLTTFEHLRYPVLKKLFHALLTVFSGPLVESTFNIMDDIVEKDRTNLTVQNYEAVAVVKTALKRHKVRSTALKITPQMKRSCIRAYATYQEDLSKKKRMAEEIKQKKLEEAVQTLKAEKAKHLAKLVKLKNKHLVKGRKVACKRKFHSEDNSDRRWKRIKMS